MSDAKKRKSDANGIRKIAQAQILRHTGLENSVAKQDYDWPNVVIVFDDSPKTYGNVRIPKGETVWLTVKRDWLIDIRPWYKKGSWLAGYRGGRAYSNQSMFPYQITLFTHCWPVKGYPWARKARGVTVAKWNKDLRATTTEDVFVGLDDNGLPFSVALDLKKLVAEHDRRVVDEVSDLAGLVEYRQVGTEPCYCKQCKRVWWLSVVDGHTPIYSLSPELWGAPRHTLCPKCR